MSDIFISDAHFTQRSPRRILPSLARRNVFTSVVRRPSPLAKSSRACAGCYRCTITVQASNHACTGHGNGSARPPEACPPSLQCPPVRAVLCARCTTRLDANRPLRPRPLSAQDTHSAMYNCTIPNKRSRPRTHAPPLAPERRASAPRPRPRPRPRPSILACITAYGTRTRDPPSDADAYYVPTLAQAPARHPCFVLTAYGSGDASTALLG